jgi:hypothetical protein
VPRDGRGADHQFIRDGLVLPPAGDEPGDLKLPRGQPAGQCRTGLRRPWQARQPGGVAGGQVDRGIQRKGKAARPQQRGTAFVLPARVGHVPVNARARDGGKP